MKILLIGNYSPDQQKSMLAFSKMIERNLHADGYEVSYMEPKRVLLPLSKKPQGFWKLIGYFDKFLIFPFLLFFSIRKFDIVHICDHSNSMYSFFTFSKPTIITCHDVLAIEAAKDKIPGWQVGMSGKFFQKLIFNGLNRANRVVCVSEYTKSHLSALGFNEDKADVALNALNENFYHESIDEIEKVMQIIGFLKNEKYFIHVGSDLVRKNRFFVLKTFFEIKKLKNNNTFKLLFVGQEPSVEMSEFIKNNNIKNSVKFLQNVNHEMLVTLYSGSIGLIFPSLQEGFGWPIIEAQACGCPVFTSNFSPMTEVGGTGAIYIDTVDALKAAKTIVNGLEESESMKVLAFDNLQRFSSERMMRDYYSAYLSVT